MHRRLAVGLAVVAFLGVALPFGVSAAPSASQPAAVESAPSFDSTTFDLTVYDNGSVRWTFEHSRPLANQSQRDEYRSFAESFNDEEGPLYRSFRNRTRRLVAAGQNATGREMSARAFSREAFVSDLGNRGVLRMSFLWSGFAPVEDGRVVVGDVFEGGLYVGPEQRLVVRAGPGLSFAAVEPAPDSMAADALTDSDSITWKGEREFTDSHPRIELVPTDSLAAATTDASNSSANSNANSTGQPAATTTTPAPADARDEQAIGMVMVGLLVLAIGLGGAVFLYSGSVPLPNFGSDDQGSASVSTPADADPPSASPPSDAEPAVSDVELLSDTDRVVKMLEENGGRMKQVTIVEETDWSKSKVSMLLSDMADEGTISKLRVGRENIISLKGFEPEAAGSPFDDGEE